MKYYGRRRRTYKKKRFYKRKTYNYRGKRRSSRSLKAVVRKVVSRNIETKQNQFSAGTVVVTKAIGAAQCIDLLPSIPQGTGESNRIGNRIQPVSLTVKIALTCANLANVYVNPSPTYFDIYIFKLKNHQQVDGAPTSVDMASFLNDDNVSQSYGGAILDGLRPINDSIFTLCKKMRVTLSAINSNVVYNGATAQYNPNRTIYVNLTKYIKSKHIFDDATLLRQNDNLWIAIGSTQTDGTDTSTSTTGSYQFITQFKYKDA